MHEKGNVKATPLVKPMGQQESRTAGGPERKDPKPMPKAPLQQAGTFPDWENTNYERLKWEDFPEDSSDKDARDDQLTAGVWGNRDQAETGRSEQGPDLGR